MSRVDLQPLRVLVEHRVDDVDERLVAVEEAVPAGEQVALEPALAQVLARAPPSRGRRARGGRRSAASRASHARSVTSKTAPSRFDAVSSGPKRRKSSRVARGSRRAGSAPSTRVASLERRPGLSARRRRSRGSRAARGRAAAAPPFACGFALIRRSPLRRRAPRSSATSAPSLVEQLLGPVAAHPRLEQREVLRVRRATLGERHLVRAPRALDRQAVDLLRAGPALRRAQHDHRPARPLGHAVARAPRAGSRRSRRAPRRAPRPSAACIAAGSSPSTQCTACSRSPRAARSSSSSRDPREHRRVGDLVAVQVQDRQHGAVASPG